MTPEQASVLSDHLRSILSEADAADVAKWAANPQHVRTLLSKQSHIRNGLCSGCQRPAEEPHGSGCELFVAMLALGCTTMELEQQRLERFRARLVHQDGNTPAGTLCGAPDSGAPGQTVTCRDCRRLLGLGG